MSCLNEVDWCAFADLRRQDAARMQAQIAADRRRMAEQRAYGLGISPHRHDCHCLPCTQERLAAR